MGQNENRFLINVYSCANEGGGILRLAACLRVCGVCGSEIASGRNSAENFLQKINDTKHSI